MVTRYEIDSLHSNIFIVFSFLTKILIFLSKFKWRGLKLTKLSPALATLILRSFRTTPFI